MILPSASSLSAPRTSIIGYVNAAGHVARRAVCVWVVYYDDSFCLSVFKSAVTTLVVPFLVSQSLFSPVDPNNQTGQATKTDRRLFCKKILHSCKMPRTVMVTKLQAYVYESRW